MNVRVAIASDMPALIDLWVSAWGAAMPSIDFEARRTWIAHRLDELAAHGAVVLVAHGQNEAAGFVTVDPDRHVDQLVVAIRHQRQGIAGLLIEAARSRSSGKLRLSVNQENHHAVRVYERLGFVVVGEGTNSMSGLATLDMEG